MRMKMLILALWTGALFADSVDMELINRQNGFVAAEFHDGETVIHDRFLMEEIDSQGIKIPEDLQEVYGGKQSVFLHDDLFQKAFKEVYYNQLDKRVFALSEEKQGVDKPDQGQAE